MATAVHWDRGSHPEVHVRRIAAARPLEWLADGLEDFRASWRASLGYGLIVAGFGLALLAFGNVHPYFIASAVSGFLLLGPFVTAGVCELSRRREAGEPLTFDDSLEGLASNRRHLGEFGGILMCFGIAWVVLSHAILRWALGASPPDVTTSLWRDVLKLLTPAEIATYVAVGGVLACIVFAISVVSVPMILDRGASAREAMRTSVRTVLTDLPAMLVWAALIVALTAVGFLTFPVGMAVIVPLLGHATWHAYRELVR